MSKHKWPNDIRVGFHLSIAPGPCRLFERFDERHCQCLQIFVGSPRVWKRSPWQPGILEEFKEECSRRGNPPLVVHSGYLINPASAKEEVREKSIVCLQEEYELAQAGNADFFVLHAGSNPDAETGLKLMAANLRRALSRRATEKPLLLLENTAGERNDLGSSLEELAWILQNLDFPAGVCFDTCHGFQAGYDLTQPGKRAEFQQTAAQTLGKGAIRVIHLNDSLKPFASGHDRHQHIGKGAIGADNLAAFLSLPICRGLPVILETPEAGSADDSFDRQNLEALRQGFEALKNATSQPKGESGTPP